MVRSKISHVLFAASLIGCAFAVGCTKSTSAPAGCGDGLSVTGGCAGVPQSSICDSDACTAGVNCTSTLNASSDATLADAASKAKAGACIVIAPGTYAGVVLPGGVSLLGKG